MNRFTNKFHCNLRHKNKKDINEMDFLQFNNETWELGKKDYDRMTKNNTEEQLLQDLKALNERRALLLDEIKANSERNDTLMAMLDYIATEIRLLEQEYKSSNFGTDLQA